MGETKRSKGGIDVKGVTFVDKEGIKTIVCFNQEAFEDLQKRYVMFPELVEALENLLKSYKYAYKNVLEFEPHKNVISNIEQLLK